MIKDIRMDTPELGIDEYVKESFSQPLIIALDNACKTIAKIEMFCMKAQEVNALFKSASDVSMEKEENVVPVSMDVVLNLVRNGEVCAKTPQEGISFCKVAKYLASSKRTHSWHSADARELGRPTTKTFLCQSDGNDDYIKAELDAVKGKMRISTTLTD